MEAIVFQIQDGGGYFRPIRRWIKNSRWRCRLGHPEQQWNLESRSQVLIGVCFGEKIAHRTRRSGIKGQKSYANRVTRQAKFFSKQRLCSLRPRPHVSGYFRTRNFFFPDTATVHTYPANSTTNPEKNKSALQTRKNISATNPISCGRGQSGKK